MKFQVGDRVLVLHSEEEGEVVDIINNKMVMVDVRGVRFPAYADQLDFPYYKRFTEKKLFVDKKKKYIDQLPSEKTKEAVKPDEGVWITFLPVFDTDEFGDDVVELLKIHLVNRSPFAYQFVYHLEYAGKTSFELENLLNGFQDFYIHDISFESLNDNPSFAIDFTPVKPDQIKASHFESVLKLKAKQVFAKIEEIRKKGEATFSFRLFDKFPDKPAEPELDISNLTNAGFKLYDASKARSNLKPPRSEVDLHIEKLTDNANSMSNFEIMSLQLQTLEKYIDINTAHHLPSMVAIHGVGTGKLRDEIHELLRLRKEVRSFVNQYDARYGYGATEIFFQY